MKIWRLAVAVAVLAGVSACSNPETDWQKTEAQNTEAAYQAFLDKYPEGEWAQKAQSQLDAIKDTRDWENAQTSDAIEAYNNYLLAHPTGAYMGEARQRITELETEAAWSAAQGTGTREALEDFLVRYADSPQAEQARTQLAALTPPPAPAPEAKAKAQKIAPSAGGSTAAARPKGSYRVQMGAFSTREKALSEKARMETRYRDVTGELTVANPTGADKLYRVRTSGMTESAAREACRRLKASRQDCVVIQP
jgi:cell division protein FtsN